MQFKLSTISRTVVAAGISLFFGATQIYPATPAFKVIAFYSTNGSGEQPDDPAHDNFAHETIGFMPKLGSQNSFSYDSTKDWTKLNDSAFLYQYKSSCFSTNLPAPSEQASLRKYIEHRQRLHGVPRLRLQFSRRHACSGLAVVFRHAAGVRPVRQQHLAADVRQAESGRHFFCGDQRLSQRAHLRSQ